MLASDVKSLYESYQSIYEENDEISSEMIEEITEELIDEIFDELLDELVEEGYEQEEAIEILDEAIDDYLAEGYYDSAVSGSKKNAAALDRAKRQKRRAGRVRYAKRKAGEAWKAVGDKVRGAVAGAEIAGSIARDEARRAGRSAQHRVTKAADAARRAPGEAKKRVKSGIKGFIKRQAEKVVSRMSEESINEADSIAAMRERAAKRRQQRYGKQGGGGRDDFRPYTEADYERGEANDPRKKVKEDFDIFDVILEHLLDEGYADTNQAALVIMANMSEEWREEILTNLNEAQKPLPTEKMKRRRYFVNMKTGEAAGSSRNQKIDSVLKAHQKDPEGEAAKARAKSKYKG